MRTTIGAIVFECLVDLGITVVYAIAAGLLIVAVAATDDTAISVLRAALYASLLPGGVLLLIGSEIGLRLMHERRLPQARSVPVRSEPVRSLSS